MSDTFEGIPIWIEQNEHGESVWVADDGYRSSSYADEAEARAALADRAVTLSRREEHDGKASLRCVLPADWLFVDYSSEVHQKYDRARWRRAGARAAEERLKRMEKMFDCLSNGETP